MKKIRDFIYNYNDIFVAAVIIAIAGAVIFWRVDSIMHYPDYIASKNKETQGETNFNKKDLIPGHVDENLNENPEEINTGDGENAGTQGTEGGEGGSENQGEPVNEGEGEGEGKDKTPPPDGKFEVPSGSSAGKVGDLLVQAGYIKSKKDFLAALNGKETKIKAGTFKIPSGAGAAEIVAILTK